VLAGAVLGMSLAALDQLIMATALPRIAGELHDLGHGAWVFTGYLITSTCGLMLWGRLGDLYGRRRVLQTAIALFVVASALAGQSRSMLELIGGRALQGAAAGALVNVPYAIVGDLVPARLRGKYLSYLAATWAASSLLGPLVGGLLVDGPGWRWIFYVHVPAGLAALLLLRALDLPTARVQHRLDVAGALLLVGAVGSLVLALAVGANRPHSAGLASGLLGASALLGLLFVRQERRVPEPLVPLAMFAHRDVRVAAAGNFLFGVANFATAIVIPLFAVVVMGTSATLGGLMLLPLALGLFAGNVFVGRRIAQTGRYRVYPAAGLVLYMLAVYLMTTAGPHTSPLALLLYTFVAGLGSGGITPVVVLALQTSVPPRDLGAASALASFSRQMGQAIGTALLGAVLAARLTHHLDRLVPAGQRAGLSLEQLRDSPERAAALAPELRALSGRAFDAAITETLWAMLAVALLTALVFLWLRERRLDEAHPPAGSAPVQ
jgi:EmrB/QacA subfamily drug resistance transporter